VHAGFITEDAGGVVMIELRPGQSRYEGSSRNGVATLSYGPWSRCFVVLETIGADRLEPSSSMLPAVYPSRVTRELT
jgi:hypothetical protein